MSKILLYMHGGSGNKGCEAIVRATIDILNKQQTNHITVATWNEQEDRKCGLDKICTLYQGANISKKRSFKRYLIYAYHKFFKNIWLKYRLEFYPFSRLKKETFDIAMSIGGDNYCYSGGAMLDAMHHSQLQHNTKHTFLWGCSIEKKYLTEQTLHSLKKYDRILARESLTYQSLLEGGLENAALYPDPAFVLPSEVCDLPEGFEESNTLGINLSPYAYSGPNVELAEQNYVDLVQWVLDNTKMKIALIPHVNKGSNSDDACLRRIKQKFDNERVIVVQDQENCMRTKYIISKCRFFVGARTHATIAAYSSKVPTIVLGYSIKAIGIAKDIFGDDENYIISVKDFKHKNEVLHKFKLLLENEKNIRRYYDEFMDGYIEKAYQAGEEVLK